MHTMEAAILSGSKPIGLCKNNEGKKGSNKFIVNYLNFCVFNIVVHLQQKIGKET